MEQDLKKDVLEEQPNKEEPKNKKVKNKPYKEKKHKNENEQKLKEENALLNDKVLRLSAEMQNMKRRYEAEISRSYKYDGEEFIKKILPIVDNFERAIKLDDSNLSDDLSKFLSGFKMIYGNLKDILKSYEVTEIECIKKAFDPNTMEAVLTEHDDTLEPGIVIDCMQKGYMYKDKVIRVAMVKVNE